MVFENILTKTVSQGCRPVRGGLTGERLGGSIPLTLAPTPPGKNPTPQKCLFLPREGNIFPNFSLAAGFHSILITEMSSFINNTRPSPHPLAENE